MSFCRASVIDGPTTANILEGTVLFEFARNKRRSSDGGGFKRDQSREAREVGHDRWGRCF